MASYNYKATDKKGKLIQGTLSASDVHEAESFLEDKGLKALAITQGKKKSLSFGGKKFPMNDKISLTRYMSLIIRSGMPIAEGLELLSAGTTNKTVKYVMDDVAASVRRGTSLFDSFGKYPKYFNTVFLTMIKTGETSGTLAESFEYLANAFHKEKELKGKIVSSMLYPIIIIVLMFAMGIMVFTFVLPRLAGVFTRMNLELPIYTRLLFESSLSFQKNWMVVLIIFIVLVVLLIVAIKSKWGRQFISWCFIRTPLLRRVIIEYNLVRFTQSLSSLLKNGVPVTESVTLSTNTLSFVDTKKLADEFNNKLTRGVSLSDCFAESKLFPTMMIQLVTIGERTGNLEHTLNDLATFYEEEVETSLKNFVSALEPAIMIVVGLAVGAMVLSVISPIYGLIGQLQNM